MNIFYLDHDLEKAAAYHVDRHASKMPLEYAQMLSTAHRVNDGVQCAEITATGRKAKRWNLSDDRDDVLYKATHINHPSAQWARSSISAYKTLLTLFECVLREYTHRYGRLHKSGELLSVLKTHPANIADDIETNYPPACMPDECKLDGIVESYRNYYRMKKQHIAKWSKRNAPEWWRADYE